MAPGDRDQPTVLVSNPGHVPWFGRAARALDDADLLGTYVVPLADAPRFAPVALRRRLASRSGAAILPRTRVRSAAGAAELAAIATRRIAGGTRVARWMADRRDRLVDVRAARSLDGHRGALLCYGAALKTATRAREAGVGTAVEQAVHHHAFNQAILEEELDLCPAPYARTMQFHDARLERDRRLGQELRTADRVVTYSEFSRRTYIDAGVPAEAVVVNQLGVDLGRWSGVQRAEDDVFRCLFLGVLTQRKGISYAVDGFRLAAIPNSELLLAGSPVRGARPWRGIRSVRERSWIHHDELASVLAETDVLVLPSLVEGLARVILEVMAAGIPAIVTPNTGGEDVITDGVDGFVVPIRDSGAIAERLVELAGDAARRTSMSEAARARAADFGWDAYERRTLAMMRDLIDGRG
jgi:glycosyltransferase involved in cell wall biosynthesis